MGLGVHLRWQKDSFKKVAIKLIPIILLSIILPPLILLCLHLNLQWMSLLGLSFAFWISFSTFFLIINQLRIVPRRKMSSAFWGMCIAHLGIAISILGVSLSSGYGVSDDVRMAPGETTVLSGYQIQFVSESSLTGPNYHGHRANFRVKRGAYQRDVYPEKRIYDIGRMAMTESAIDVTAFRDIYIALGEPLSEDAWSVRLYYKPFVRWIWGGGFFILFGGLLALVDKRYYQKEKVSLGYEAKLIYD